MLNGRKPFGHAHHHPWTFTGALYGQALYYHPGDNPGYLSFTGCFPSLSMYQDETA